MSDSWVAVHLSTWITNKYWFSRQMNNSWGELEESIAEWRCDSVAVHLCSCVCFADPQDMQTSLDRESSGLQDLESQKQDAQERLEEMDQQRSKLDGMLSDVKTKCQGESQMVRDRMTNILGCEALYS